MSTTSMLESRLQAEFAAYTARAAKYRATQLQEHEAKEERLARFIRLLDELRDLCRPKLEALAAQFKDVVKVEPEITPSQRQATFAFESPLAHINLRFRIVPDNEVRRVVVTYDLEILPIFIDFERHSEIVFPLEQVDHAAIAQWLDDRIVAFVKVYLSLYENEYYLKDHMVEDPVVHVRFPKFLAGAKLDCNGQTYYFIDEATKKEFEAKSA
ncbi:MAG: hypothetical protein U1A77_07455 [Pirellulales bacterium]